MPAHLTALLPEYLLGIYVVAGLVAAALLGAGIGSTGLTLALRDAYRARRVAARAAGRAALHAAQRDEARRQQQLAEDALAAATHPITSTDDRPETDLDALIRAVTDGTGRALPQPSAEDPNAWVWGEHQ